MGTKVYLVGEDLELAAKAWDLDMYETDILPYIFIESMGTLESIFELVKDAQLVRYTIGFVLSRQVGDV